MNIIIATIIALSSLQAMASVDITNKEAQTIINGIQWQKLGKRTQFQLTNAKAECMTLSNYDNKVDFDCIINNSTEEVVISTRDLENIISTTAQKLPLSGLNLNAERANMLCFMSGKCQLTSTLSPAEEKHSYCYMTSYSRYTGSLIEESTSQETVIINSVHCKAETGGDFLGNKHTIITAELKIRGDIGSTLGVDTFHSWGSIPGVVDEKMACQIINDTLNQGQQVAIVERQLSDNESTSIRNTDKGLFEKISLRFPNNVILNGAKNKQVVEGAFCAGFAK